MTGNPDGTGRTPFPNNQIPADRISPIARRILANIPMPNPAGAPLGGTNYEMPSVREKRTNQYDIKITTQLTPEDHLSVRYSYQNAATYDPATFGIWGRRDSRRESQPLFERHQYDRRGWLQRDARRFLGVAAVGPLRAHVHKATTATKLHGNHTIKLGGDLRYNRDYLLQVQGNGGQRGVFRFRGATTAIPSNTSAQNGFANAFAAFLLDAPQSLGRDLLTDVEDPGTRHWGIFSYIHDKWQVRPNITIDLGLRHEYYTPLVGLTGRGGLSNYDPVNNTLRVAGYSEVPENLGVKSYWKNFAPRTGVSWRLSETNVVRAGYGASALPWPSSYGLNYPAKQNNQINPPNSFAAAGSAACGAVCWSRSRGCSRQSLARRSTSPPARRVCARRATRRRRTPVARPRCSAASARTRCGSTRRFSRRRPPAPGATYQRRGLLTGPAYVNVDFSLVKILRFGSRRAEVRADVFNLLNRAHYNNPNGTFGDGNFGRITSILPQTERAIRFGGTVSVLTLRERREGRGQAAFFALCSRPYRFS